jgi:hypothetical protein
MKLKLGMVGALALALVMSTYAQKKPDFSGSWKLDPEASGMAAGGAPGGGGGRMGGGPAAMTVKQTDDALTVESEGRQGPVTRTYKLDGSETEVTMGQMTAKVSAKWNGDKLVITTKTDNGEQTATWSVDGSTLTIENAGGRGPSKRVYKK